MSSPIVTVARPVTCAHGGTAHPASTAGRVRIAGTPVRQMSVEEHVAGCPNTTPGPCVTGRWVSGSVRVRAQGQPVVLADSASTSIPMGAPLETQPGPSRVTAA
jgi:hypothetical protein